MHLEGCDLVLSCILIMMGKAFALPQSRWHGHSSLHNYTSPTLVVATASIILVSQKHRITES